MKIMLAVAAAAALGLAACATPGGADSYHVQAEKVLLAAEGGFNVAATAERAFCPDGVVKTSTCTRGDDLRHQGYQLLLAARTAYNNGQVPDTAALTALTAQLVALVPPKKGS